MDCWGGSRRAKQCPMEWVLAVRKRSLVALTDPRLVLTTPKDGAIGLPDRLTGVNITSRKPIPLRDRIVVPPRRQTGNIIAPHTLDNRPVLHPLCGNSRRVANRSPKPKPSRSSQPAGATHQAQP